MQFDRDHRDKAKPRTDHTESYGKEVSSEKITVTRLDTTRTEETEKHEYPRELDIGRIIIEEIPDEKEEIPDEKEEIQKRKEIVKPGSTEMTVMREVKEVSRDRVTGDVVKVGKLDTTDTGKTPVESTRLEERVTSYKERVDGARKVLLKDANHFKLTRLIYFELT